MVDEIFLRLWNGDFDKSYDKTLKETKSQLKDIILKEVLIMPECNCKHARSILNEQRTKLNELFEGKDK